MSALGGVVRSGVGRRRVQTIVIALVVLVAVTAAVLGATLMVASTAPFDRAFAQQRGAHLTVRFDASRTTPALLAATASAPGVTAVTGPFPIATINVANDRGGPARSMTVAGRADPGGPVDAVTLTEGRWVTGPGEIVPHSDGSDPQRGQPRVGDVLRLPDLPGAPVLTVVGIARSVSETAGGWVVPEQVSALTTPGSSGEYEMLYRLAAADTTARIDAGLAAIRASLPEGAAIGTRFWLTTRTDSAGSTVLLVPFLLAFGALGVLMAVLIIGNVIAGAVGAGTRRIGILKALGFTPHQVVRAYTVQALIPAVVGAVVGVVAGNLLVGPVLTQTNRIHGTSDSGVAPWVDVAVLSGALAVVTVTALVAASRAGRLRTVDALAVGRTPGPGRGQLAARLATRLPLPRPVTLGLAHPFARVARSTTIVAAVAFGAAAATFAVGLGASLNQVQDSENYADVIIHPARPGGGAPTAGPPPGPDPVAVVAAITAQAGTNGYSGTARTEVTAAGLTTALETIAFTGDDTDNGYRMVAGTWFGRAGEIVVSKPFLTATRTGVGDTIVLTDHGTPITVRIVGEVFNTESRGMQILTSAATLAATQPELRAVEYTITLRPGTDREAYLRDLNAALTSAGATAVPAADEPAEVVLVIDALTALLTLMLITVAALGVLNVVVLETRERVHDLGVHKALGMTPRQTIAMVIASVVVTGFAGGAIGVPVGVAMQRIVVGEMGNAAGFDLPAAVVDVYQPAQLALCCVGGLLIAVLGAVLPAGWAARVRTATALRTE